MNIIGIDPGQTTGLCIMNERRQVVLTDSLSWHFARVIERVLCMAEGAGDVIYAVEVPKHVVYADINALHGRGKAIAAQRTGMVIARAECLAEWLEEARSPASVMRVQPKKRRTKWTPQYIRAAFQWSHPTNEHVRDAIATADTALALYQAQKFRERAQSWESRKTLNG